MLLTARPARLSDGAAEQIQQLIEEENLSPGDRLPPERELAQRLGVGRSSLREGLRMLELTGLIEIQHGKGVFLKEGAAAPLDKVIRSWLSAHKGALRDLVELREALETQAASLAAQRASQEDVASMGQLIAAMRLATDADDPERYVDGDTAFHAAIARASGNNLLRRALASVARETVAYRLATARLGRPALERSHADHAAIWKAIEAGDAVAAQTAMRQHIVGFPLDLHLFDDPERQVAG